MANASQGIEALGLVWYREADYDKLRSLFVDGHVLPRSFLQWQDQAEQIRKRCVREGKIVVKAYVDPETFPAWCVANGCNLDAAGRMKFASSEAYRIYVEAQQSDRGGSA